MKKIYLLSFLLFFSVSFSKAQTSLTTAADFTVTDTDGNSHNLFTILNSGKYVCLDFFFTTCGPCQSTCGYFKETFTNYGCNTQDVFFMSIDMGDTDAEVEAYETAFLGGAAGFPAASGIDGGGDAVVSAYGIGAFPTYVLIAPDHSIIEQDMWPISSAANFDTYFNAHGLVYKACLTGIEESVLSAGISVYPNPATDQLTVEALNGETIKTIAVIDVLGRSVKMEALNGAASYTLDVSGLDAGMYQVEVLNQNGLRGLKKFSKQ